MIGKLIGKVVGEAVALPLTVLSEGAKALNEAGDTLSKRADEAFEPATEKRPCR